MKLINWMLSRSIFFCIYIKARLETRKHLSYLTIRGYILIQIIQNLTIKEIITPYEHFNLFSYRKETCWNCKYCNTFNNSEVAWFQRGDFDGILQPWTSDLVGGTNLWLINLPGRFIEVFPRDIFILEIFLVILLKNLIMHRKILPSKYFMRNWN